MKELYSVSVVVVVELDVKLVEVEFVEIEACADGKTAAGAVMMIIIKRAVVARRTCLLVT